jgi:elongation factor Ts
MPRYIDSYVHKNVIGVLIELSCREVTNTRTEDLRHLANDLAKQIVATTPMANDDAAATADVDEFTRRRLKKNARISFAVSALLEQPFFKDPRQTVAQVIREVSEKLGDEIRVVRFARFQADKH